MSELKSNPKHSSCKYKNKLRKLVADNIEDSKFGVTKLAQLLYVERSTLFRHCKQELKISPSKFICITRLQIARALLLKPQLTITEVAFKSGFNSVSHFSNLFRKVYGVSPSSVRKQAMP